MASQTLTLHLPDSTYQRLVDLAQKSDRPLEEETPYLLNAALTQDSKLSPELSDRLNQLALLTDDELWKAASARASEEDNNFIQVLLEKQQREGLTSDEFEQVQALSKHFNQIMLVRAKAVALLFERGCDIPQLTVS